MTRGKLHAIYGLYLPNQPGMILYVGSWRVATLDERLRQHRDGECKTTSKCAARHGVKILDLRMRVLRYWTLGIEANPEGEIMLGLQAQCQCRWNHPYAFTTEDLQKGGRVQPREAKVRGGYIGGCNAAAKMTPEELSERARIGGRVGIRKMQETWGKTPEAHEAKVRGGRIGGHNQPREAKCRGGRTAMRKLQQGWGQTPAAHEHHVRIGPIAGRLGGRATADSGWHETPEAHKAHVRGGRNQPYEAKIVGPCTRWHGDRPKINRLCKECAALVVREDRS